MRIKVLWKSIIKYYEVFLIITATTQTPENQLLPKNCLYCPNHLMLSRRLRRFFVFFLYLGFPLQTFTNHRIAVEGGGQFFNSSLPLPPALQALWHWQGIYCWGQLDSIQELLVSERKSLTTKLCSLLRMVQQFQLGDITC